MFERKPYVTNNDKNDIVHLSKSCPYLFFFTCLGHINAVSCGIQDNLTVIIKQPRSSVNSVICIRSSDLVW